MGTVTSVVTVDTGEWVYIDSTGTPHTVTNAETFNLTIDDTSATVVNWYVLPGESVVTDDGYTIEFRTQVTAGGEVLKMNTGGDTLYDGVAVYSAPGEWPMSISVNNVIQNWKPAQFYTSDVDMAAAGTIGANTAVTQFTMEDQFGNVMKMPSSLVAGITVAQAA